MSLPLGKRSRQDQESALGGAFSKFDSDGDGIICKGEFTKLMNNLGGFSKTEIDTLFAEADSDKSGGVDWKEFVRWICSTNAANRFGNDGKEMVESFSRLLQQELHSEAAFVSGASMQRVVENFVMASNQEKAEADATNAFKKKQNKAKQAMEQEHPSSYSNTSMNWDHMAGIPAAHDGYRIPIPFTFEGAEGLRKHYLQWGASRPLHPKYVSHMISEFTKAYAVKYPNPCVSIDTPAPGRLVVVGDTHGQLADVLYIMHQLGPPTSQNRYLFNGDIADRGENAVEIFLILFAFFLADPDCLIINRGNHENENMNALDFDQGGGFEQEVCTKYGLPTYRRFMKVFRVLSLCSVVQNQIFVVHGGLTRQKALTIDYINTLGFHECSAPYPLSTGIKEQVFSDLLWSDPSDFPGKYKSERGVGIKFGPDLTMKFCRTNQLRFIIRSHQVPEDGHGFFKQHDNRCVTIFSASNYCGSGGNFGAALVLATETFPKYEIYEHFAPPLEELPKLFGVTQASAQQASDPAKAEEVARKEQEAHAKDVAAVRWQQEVDKMIASVIEKKPDLWSQTIDLSQGAHRSLDDFEDTMSTMVDANLPWSEGARFWGIVKDDMVDMVKFLRRWRVGIIMEGYSLFVDRAVGNVYQAMLCLDMDMERTFRYFDKDSDGTVDIKEMRQVLGMFDLALTSSQIERLTGEIFARIIEDAGGTGDEANVRVSVADFLNNFMVVYKNTNNVDLPGWVVEALDKIGRLIFRLTNEALVSDVSKAAAKIQKVFRGNAVRKELGSQQRKASASLPRSSSNVGGSPKARASASVPRRTKVGEGGSGGKSLANRRCSENHELDLSQGGMKIAALFDSMDTSGDGFLDVDEFSKGILSIQGSELIEVDGEKLSHNRLVELANFLDVSGNGTINYLEFLQALTPAATGNTDIADSLCEDITTVLFRHRVALRKGCQLVDEPGCGKISAEDFQTVLMGVNKALSKAEHALTDKQIAILVNTLATEETEDEGSYVDYDKLLRSFVIFDCSTDKAIAQRRTLKGPVSM